MANAPLLAATSFAPSDEYDDAAFSCSLTSLARGNGGFRMGRMREACGENMIHLEGEKRKVADLRDLWQREDKGRVKGFFHVMY